MKTLKVEAVYLMCISWNSIWQTMPG
jgi:hypothetical protein